MASIKYTNNARTTLAADLNDSATSATVVNGNVFPALGAGEHFYCTFDDLTNTEIVKVTARSTHVLTIVRAQDNTSARAFSSGHKAELRITAVVLEEVAGVLTTPRAIAVAGDVTGTANFDGSANISITTTLATDAIVTANITNANVTVAKMAANSVDSDQYVDGSIDLIHMSANSVDSDQYVDGSIDTVHLADDAVTGAKLADNIDIAGTLDVTGILTADSNVVVAGNLTVNGTTTTLNTATLDVEDKNITINYGAGDTSASANGAGITIQDAIDASNDATILWDTTNDEFDFSHAINVTGNIAVSGTVDGRDVASDGSKLDGIESGATADQTAAQILTAIKTVDGAGSGLDADLLDGLSSASFATSAQGTLAANALPKSGGAMTGAITTNSTFDGRDVATDGAKLDGIAAGATNTVTNATHTGEVTGSGALTIANDVVDAGNLKVTGNGTTSQFLRSDGDGTFTWATPTDTNTTYSAGTGLSLTGTTFANTSPNVVQTTITGNAGTATTLQTARTISLTGAVTGSVSFNGSSNVSITTTNTADPTITLTGAVTGTGTMTNLGNVSITTTATADPTLTLSGDASGSATFTNLGNATLSVTIADDSHNHVISNIDGLQTALDAKLASSSYTAADVLTKIKTVDGAGSGLDADLLDGISSASFLRGDATDAFTTLSGTQLTANLHSANSGVDNGFTFWGTAETYSIKMGDNQTNHGTVTDYSMHHNMGTTAGRGFTFGSSRTAVTCSINALTGAILSSNNITAYSDIRVKDNIEVIPNALDKVSQLSGYTFTRTDVEDKEKKYTGVLAQEVLKVLPEAVQLGATEKDTMSVAYGNMVGLLIESIKELKTEVDDLKKQLDESK